MKFLINASNLKKGGGLQVADSICCELNKYPQHHFVIVLSNYLHKTAERISEYSNVEVVLYDSPKYNLWLLLTGRDEFMDNLVKEKNTQTVLSIFGPNLWVPRCPHICGFARPHLLIPESQYFTRMCLKERLKNNIMNYILKLYFKRSSKIFFTENPYISERLEKLLPNTKVYTITNNYNQIFDLPEKWIKKELPDFDGKSFLCITAPYPHKNLPIAIDIANIWMKEKPDFKFRFVFTITPADYPELSPELASHFLLIGKVDVAECPSLYEQCDIAFQPTLLECFTATYPEAMRMKKPIVTTDMEFAKGICGNAACYYCAVDARDAAEVLYKVATDKEYANTLVENGEKQLLTFDDYEQRTERLIDILEQIGNKQ